MANLPGAQTLPMHPVCQEELCHANESQDLDLQRDVALVEAP